MTTQPHDTPRYALGQTVRVIANNGGLYSAQIGVVGIISKQRQKRRYGYRSYDVSYMKPFSLPNEKGREKIVIVREDDLEAFPNAADAAIPEQSAEQPPKFSVSELVSVDEHSAVCYAPYTHKGAIGVIVGVGKPVRGIRRYDVRYSGDTPAIQRAIARDPLHALPVTQIREEHLVQVDVPTVPESLSEPPRPAVSRHAYEYRAEKQRKGERLWCDAGGSFIEDCAVCRAMVGDTLDTLMGDAAVTVFACARGRGAVTCAHAWQVWPDGRYRHCPKCKQSERVKLAESEMTQ